MDGGKGVMSRSLQRHLSLMLSMAILAGGIIASGVSFYFAYSEAQEFQDDSLRQVAAISVGSSASENLRLDAASKTIDDPESRIQVYRLPQEKSPAWLPTNIRVGFHTLEGPSDQGRMRVLVREARDGSRIVVAQSTESRDEIARGSALRTMIPLLILLPVLVLWMAQIVRRELATVRHLSHRLDQQAADQPLPLPEQGVPDEITPFVQAINRLLSRVTRMISEQRRFVADAAHELRTPLTALSLQAQNISQAESIEIMRERLVPLQAGIERARKLTAQLLSLARMQAGTNTSVQVDISNLARGLVAEYLPLAEEKKIDLGIEGVVSLTLNTDPETLRLILRNALENALKYTPEKGVVTIRFGERANSAVIEVIDNGPGIPDIEFENVFGAFYRLSENSGSEGSGLGLAIAREAANRLGGNVSLHSRTEGNGLVFCYTQPLKLSTV
jgi:two-component system, OmpR family, sensor kinase